MIYNSSALLGKNNSASYSLREMSKTPESYVECLLQLNESMQEAETEYNIAYYRALKESALNESTDLVIQESLVGKAVDFIARIIDAIINFIKKIINMIRGKNTKNVVEKKEKAQQRAEQSNDFESFKSKTGKFTYYHLADWNSINPYNVIQACQTILVHISDICAGNEIASPSDEDLTMAYKALVHKTFRNVRNPKTYTKPVTDADTFKEFVLADVIYSETKDVTGAEYMEYTKTIHGTKEDPSKYLNDIVKELEACRELLKRNNTGLVKEQITNAKTYIRYFDTVVKSWTWFVQMNYIQFQRAFDYHADIMDKVSGFSVNESSTIHGELFNSDTLFANEDMRDFNRTEWLDLNLTVECYTFNQAVIEARRSMAVQEAIIMSENSIDTFRKLKAMQEAELGKLGDAISQIMARIKEFITKFINDIQDKHGPNAAFLKKYEALIKNPIKLESVTSAGNIFEGLERTYTEPRFKSFDPNTMKEENKAEMFKNHFLASYPGSGGKRPVKWEDGITISDYCKAYFGASMPEDQYKPVTYNRAEIERAKPDILQFLNAPHAFFSKIKAEMSSLEREAKKAGAEAIKPGAANTTAEQPKAGENQASSNQGSGNAEAKQESMFYSTLYDRWFTEMEIDAGAANNSSAEAGKGGDDAKAAPNTSKVYIDCMKDILLAKLTAARFIYSECNQLIRAHAKTYMTKEQKAAEAKAGGAQKDQKQQPAGNAEQPAAANG